MLVIQIGLALRTRPILKLLARLLPELYSTRSYCYYILHFIQGHCFGGSGYVGVGDPQFFYASITALTLGKIIRLLGFTFQLPPPVAESGFTETAEVRLVHHIKHDNHDYSN